MRGFAQVLNQLDWKNVSGLPKNVDIHYLTKSLEQEAIDACLVLEILPGPDTEDNVNS